MTSRRNVRDDNNDDDDTVSDRSSVEGFAEVSSQFDEMMKTLDDDPTDFDPNDHWVSCVGRFCYEISPFQNWFLVQDPPFTGRTLDIPASFAPTGPCPIIGKMMSLVSVVAVFVWAFVKAEHRGFVFAYLHAWNLIYSIVYFYCSLLNTLMGVAQPFSRVNGSVRVCWFMFIVAAQCGILEAILFWTRECDYETVKYDFLTIMLHGGVTLELILDGFTVNVIPLRWMHWWGCCLIPNIMYYGWTLIHAFFMYVGNPDVDTRNSIYETIEWRYNWKRSFWDAIIVLFGISPLIFLILWMMSLYRWCFCCCFFWRRERRHYLESTGNLDKYRELAREQERERREKEALKEKEKLEKEALKEKEEEERLAAENEKAAFLDKEESMSVSSTNSDRSAGWKKRFGFLAGRKKEHSV